jgi:hypothetical protein
MLTREEKRSLAEKRVSTLAKAWLSILRRGDVPGKHFFTLNPSIVAKTVRHYVSDLDHLKYRYGIEDRAQPPKVAGLMTSAILKYRPLVPTDAWASNIDDFQPNELLAIFHGITVCAEYGEAGLGNKAMAALMVKPHFRVWLDRFLFLLRERNYTSESLIMTFETLCMAAFPDSMYRSSPE